jgi:hypothetical protein
MSGVILTGMHRSGTSLFSNYLMACGVNMGETFLDADKGNPLGYYESLDIVQFHERVLQRNGYGYFFDKFPDIGFNDNEKNEAKRLISHKSKSWKDPKTVLFLESWKEILPTDTKYIFLYRDPIKVSDSLIRRQTDNVINQFPHLAIQNWYIYNSLIYRFIQSICRSNYLLIDIDHFISDFDKHHKLIYNFLGSLVVQKDIKLNDFFVSAQFKKKSETIKLGSLKSKLLYRWHKGKSNILFKKLKAKL